MGFPTPQDAEDAYYDALESADAQAMAAVWAEAEDVFCLLPMAPLAIGSQVRRLWQALFARSQGFDLQVRHLLWIEQDDLAIHLVEEHPQVTSGDPPPPIYALHIFQRGPDGWRLLIHQNSPGPLPSPFPMSELTALA
ncbi:nuclear transport factor 2 family protein [Caldichromatium japonicum]|uniref:Nuclear transport factor 2 family protein n=1 Tax=Caldichromatium japonicum TaxID=2699430 RepID=A0A6G7VCA7_9GAMM|nr:nuclear transport factor 2 family protein [Caldichromatium japonicum]QIK37540.1 nuclear transport factor 2 family protein [Caldichromatium japonicum]